MVNKPTARDFLNFSEKKVIDEKLTKNSVFRLKSCHILPFLDRQESIMIVMVTSAVLHERGTQKSV